MDVTFTFSIRDVPTFASSLSVNENLGTTISDLLKLLQAIWPGNFSTSSTITVLASAHDVPHTPFPLRMRVQATGPWNGPSTSSSLFSENKKWLSVARGWSAEIDGEWMTGWIVD